jgi:hypothetical protein
MMAECRRDDIKTIAKASAARAFIELEHLKRLLKMQPAPRPVEVTSSESGQLIDYRKLVRRPPKAIIDVAEAKLAPSPPAVPTEPPTGGAAQP